MNRVWIELEKPTAEEGDDVGNQRAALANKLLKKLGVNHDVFQWWGKDERQYIRIVDPDSGAFVWLSDNGDWFNLNLLQLD